MWISVSNKMPEKYSHSLVYYCKDWNASKIWNIGFAFLNSEGHFAVSGDGIVYPTHWQPLPEPPNNKQLLPIRIPRSLLEVMIKDHLKYGLKLPENEEDYTYEGRKIEIIGEF